MFKPKFSSSGGSFKANFASSKNNFDSEFNHLQIIKGEDGFSPLVDIQEDENGYTINITDKDGTESFEITNGVDGYTPIKGVDYFDGIDGINGKDGTDGRDGVDGKDGIDGYTPIKGVDYFDGKDGVNGIDGRDGKDGYTPIKGIDYFDGTNGRDGIDGKDGKDGIDGKDGYTPIKGTDYFTEEDVQEIVDKVAEEMPTPVTSWNDLTDKPFGEDTENITLTEFVAPMFLSFANGQTSAFEAALGMAITASGGFVEGKTYGVSLDGEIYECICAPLSTPFSGTLYELKAVGEHGVNVYCSIASYYHYVSAPVTDGTYSVAIYEMTRGIKRLDEKFLPDSVVLESELEAKGYQTEEQVTALINNAISNLPKYNGEVEEI